MDIVRTDLGRVVVLEAPARLDHASAPSLTEAVRSVLDRAGSGLLIDMAKVTFVSSIGLSVLLQSAKLAQAQGGRVALSGLSGLAREAFDMASLGSLLAAYPSREEARAFLEIAAPRRATGARDLQTGLSLPAEVLLLALHDESGRLVDLPDHALEFAMAGAVLLDLQLHRRIDADAERVTVVDRTPVGDPILDPALEVISRSGARHDVEHWVALLAIEGREIERRVVDGLVHAGLLRRKASVLEWVLGRRRYPVLEHSEQREVRERVLAILKHHEIPGPRDVAIIALADACAVFDALLDMDEMLEIRPRISEIARLDLIAQGVIRALREAQSSAPHAAATPRVYVSRI